VIAFLTRSFQAMVTNTHSPETREQALRRLAGEAHKRGIRVVSYPPTGEVFSLSLSHPELLHRVTPISCDCLGFSYHGRCTHNALLLEEIGALPADSESRRFGPEVEQAPAVLCDQCDQVMEHINGVTFRCQCGQEFTLDWDTAISVDAAISALSQSDGERFQLVRRLLSASANALPSGADPDHYPSRADVPGVFGRFEVDANVLAAVLIWREDQESLSEAEAA
jgi:hypothetical protein